MSTQFCSKINCPFLKISSSPVSKMTISYIFSPDCLLFPITLTVYEYSIEGTGTIHRIVTLMFPPLYLHCHLKVLVLVIPSA